MSQIHAIPSEKLELVFIDGKIYFSNVYPIQKMDELYKTVFLMQKNVLVTAKYTFISQIESVKPNVSLAVESRHMESVCVNGEDIKDKVTGTWLDQSILKYDISEIIDNGVNTVEISFNVERMHNLSLAEGKYETEINRFIYEVELESIYILGNFDVNLFKAFNCRLTPGAIIPPINSPLALTMSKVVAVPKSITITG